MLHKDGELILKNELIADIFKHYFGSIVETFNLEQWNKVPLIQLVASPITSVIIKKCINHHSLTALV